MNYFNIIPLGFINKPLTYKYHDQIKIGSLVYVKVRKKQLLGVVLSKINPAQIMFDKSKILSIIKHSNYIFKNSHIEFILYLSKHYFIDLGIAFKISIGSEANISSKTKNFLTYDNQIYLSKNELIKKNNISNKYFEEMIIKKNIFEIQNSFLFKGIKKNINLNLEQKNIFGNIALSKKDNFSCHLIDGVTGSGKTELYFSFIIKSLLEKKQILVLLPEIALTDDWALRFDKYFGCMPYIWHSKQTVMQKSRILRSLINGEPCVVVGARSSVLLPFSNLKLVVCDEEHDSSYKQDDGPRYNARDMAIYKSSKEKALCLIVSASPSLESLYNVKLKKIKHHKLYSQFSNTTLPKISLIDMNQSKPSSTSWISKEMFDKTKNILNNNGQVLFFLNRRGYAPSRMCVNCHSTIQCKSCAVNLVYHKAIKKLVCHYCAKLYDINYICLKCSDSKFVSLGIGLERLHDELIRLFPGVPSQIFSSDTLKNKINKKLFFENVHSEKTKILVGSQIIGKSFHFPNLKLVNIIEGDSTLHSSDFRSLEKTYQLFQQVAGRSGREGAQGTVLIQSYNIAHPLFQSLIKQDRDTFISAELERRKASLLPPYYKLAVINILHKKQICLKEINLDILSVAKKLKIKIYGPTPALIPYKKGHFHEIFFLKEETYLTLGTNINSLKSLISVKNQRFLNIDIDPIHIS